MSKYIDAEKLDFVSYQGIPDGYKDSFDSGVLYAMNLIDEQPTVDAVPVVRCRDCKHKDVLPDLYGIGNEALYCPVIKHYVKHDFFCKYGEKVTEDVII